MLTAKINHNSRTLTILYPKYTRRRASHVRVRSFNEATEVFRNRNARFICSELTKFLNTREYAYRKSDCYHADRQNAVRHIRWIISAYGKGNTAKLYRHIANARVSFAVLMPLKPSKAKKYFERRIIPIIQYCQKQDRQFN